MNRLRGTCRPDASFRSFNRKCGPLPIIIYVMVMTMGAVDNALPTPCGFRNLSHATWKSAESTSTSARGYSPGYDPAGDGRRGAGPYFWISNFAEDDFGSYIPGRSQHYLTAGTIASQDSSDGGKVPDTGTVTIYDGAYTLPPPLDWLVSKPKGIPSGFHMPSGRELARFNYAGSNPDGVSWENVGMKVGTRGWPLLLRGWLSELPAEKTAAATGEHDVLSVDGGISRDSFAWAEVAEPGTVTIGDGVCTWSAQPDWRVGEAWGSPRGFYTFPGWSLAEINYAGTNTDRMSRETAGRKVETAGWFFAPSALLSDCRQRDPTVRMVTAASAPPSPPH